MTSEVTAPHSARTDDLSSGGLPAGRPASIAIIDDDRSLLRLLSMIFRDADFAVQTYLDARLALDEITKEQPEAIILDLEMPLMNGREFYHAARAAGVTTPVLILSAYGARNAQQELGAQAFVDKPFEPETLIDSIRRLLGQARNDGAPGRDR